LPRRRAFFQSRVNAFHSSRPLGAVSSLQSLALDQRPSSSPGSFPCGPSPMPRLTVHPCRQLWPGKVRKTARWHAKPNTIFKAIWTFSASLSLPECRIELLPPFSSLFFPFSFPAAGPVLRRSSGFFGRGAPLLLSSAWWRCPVIFRGLSKIPQTGSCKELRRSEQVVLGSHKRIASVRSLIGLVESPPRITSWRTARWTHLKVRPVLRKQAGTALIKIGEALQDASLPSTFRYTPSSIPLSQVPRRSAQFEFASVIFRRLLYTRPSLLKSNAPVTAKPK